MHHVLDLWVVPRQEESLIEFFSVKWMRLSDVIPHMVWSFMSWYKQFAIWGTILLIVSCLVQTTKPTPKSS